MVSPRRQLARHAERQSRPIFENVAGAPFRIGQRVVINALADDTAETSLLSERGIIEYFEYNCGCGQSFPGDPMIGVRFGGGKIEEFWYEELKLV